MDMHRCLPTLHKTGMGIGKIGDELEKDRPLVIGARIWLAVCLQLQLGAVHTAWISLT